MSIFTSLLAYIKGEVNELEKEASAFEQAILPGIEASAKQAVKVFGEQALPIAEQLAVALVTGIASGGNPSVLIPQLVNDGIKDLAPYAIADGKNALYTMANLALAQGLGNGTIVLPVPATPAPAVSTPVADTSASAESAVNGTAS